MQPHPQLIRRGQLAQFAAEILDMAAHLTVFPGVHIVLAVQPVGRGVLRNHQQFAHARIHQLLRLAQHRMGRARGQFAAHVGDDAELALVVATL